MSLSLDATALSFDLPKLRRKHPNRLPFRGVLTVLDVPSDRAPTGSNNRRVLIPCAVAEAALPSLIGMALDYTPALDGHDSRRKIGIITAAHIRNHVGPGALARTSGREAVPPVIGSALEVRGYIFARDFPEVVLELLRATSPAPSQGSTCQPSTAQASSLSTGGFSRSAATACSPPVYWREKAAEGPSPVGATAVPIANALGTIYAAAAANSLGVIRAHVTQPFDFGTTLKTVPNLRDRRLALGMSYEIAEAQIVSEASPIWVLKDFLFTGAAVLRRDHAAYQNTSIELMND